MSVVIGIKYDKGVLLGGDTQITNNHLKKGKTKKVFSSKYSQTAIGVVGNLRDANLLETQEEWINYKDILDKTDIDKKYIIQNIVPKLYNLQKTNHCLSEGDTGLSESAFLFATPDKIFSIGRDYGIIEFNDYYACGSGYELVFGYLEKQYKNKLTFDEAIKLINEAIQLVCEKEIFINDEVYYINLEKERR